MRRSLTKLATIDALAMLSASALGCLEVADESYGEAGDPAKSAGPAAAHSRGRFHD
jgi:hypothetical protein